ncbi:MAG TPA: hypothetical protein VG097_12700 [Gemmata sp.]|jgi:hypothetical protein|nr:hypothetical protein [Gemmata sp.]
MNGTKEMAQSFSLLVQLTHLLEDAHNKGHELKYRISGLIKTEVHITIGPRTDPEQYEEPIQVTA